MMKRWLTKICQAKPMALPKRDEVPFGMDGPGAEIIDDVMRQDTALKQEEQYPDIRYIGHGYQGIAYDLGDKVLKYTRDSHEVDRAIGIKQKPIPCAIRVLDIRWVQGEPGEPFIWSILLEKARPLDPNESNIVAMMYEDFSDWDEIRWKDDYAGFEYLFTAYSDMISCLEHNGFSTFEARADNIGWVDGRLVLFDLGPHPIERGY